MDSRFRGNDGLKTAVSACGLSSLAVNLSHTLFRPENPVFCAVNVRMGRHLMQLTGLSFWNSPGNESRLAELGLDLGNDWGEEDESGYVQTRIGLAPIGDDGTVDLAPLRTAAADALAAVRGRTE